MSYIVQKLQKNYKNPNYLKNIFCKTGPNKVKQQQPIGSCQREWPGVSEGSGKDLTLWNKNKIFDNKVFFDHHPNDFTI